MEEEEMLPSLLLRPLSHKHRCVEQGFSSLMDHYDHFRELPRLLDPGGLREGVSDSPGAGGGAAHSGDEGMGEGRNHRTGSEKSAESQRSLPRRQPTADQQDSPRVPTARPRASQSGPPSPKALSQSLAFPGQLANGSKRPEDRKSHSSSLTSLGENAASERRGTKLHAGSRRAPSQDGIISPETDSGFVGSESSRLTPAGPSPLHQRATASLSVPQEERPEKPHKAPVPGPPLPAAPSQRPTSLELSGGSRLSSPSQVPRGSSGRAKVGGERERRSTSASSSPQHWATTTPQAWAGRTHQHWAGSGTSEFGPDSDHIPTVSGEEEGQSDRSTHQPTNPQRSHRPRPSPTAPCHHGDPLQAQGPGQLTSRNEALQSLQAEVTRLKERLEGSLRPANLPSPVRAPPSAQGDHTHPLTSTPGIRFAQRRRDGGREQSREERRMGEEEEEEEERTPRPTPSRRSASVPRQRPQLDMTTDSEQAQSTPRPRPSRRTPESPAGRAGSRGRAETVRSRGGAHTRQQQQQCPRASVCVRVSGGRDEPDSRGRQAPAPPVCPWCPPAPHNPHRHPTLGGKTAPMQTGLHSHHCPLCGRCETRANTSTEPERRMNRDSGPTPRGSQPMSSPHRDVRGVLLAAPPPPVLGSVPLVQCVPVCPPVLYYSSPVIKAGPPHPQPLYLSLSGGVASGGRGRPEVRVHSGRSLSADRRDLNSSLNRAIEAARGMRTATRRMAHSLATGLHHQGALSQSCMD